MAEPSQEAMERPWPVVILRRWEHHAPDDISSYSVLPEGHTEPPSAHGREGMIYVPEGELTGLRDRLDYESELAEEAENRFESCENCERPSREEDLKAVWGREPESDEQVDLRLCLVCRLGAEYDKKSQELLRIFDDFVSGTHPDPIPGSDGIFTNRRELAQLRAALHSVFEEGKQ